MSHISLRRESLSGDLTNLYYLTRLPPCSFMVARLDRDWRTTVSSSDPESRLTNLSISTILLRSTFLLGEEDELGCYSGPSYLTSFRSEASPSQSLTITFFLLLSGLLISRRYLKGTWLVLW